jgi:hypothetical protein
MEIYAHFICWAKIILLFIYRNISDLLLAIDTLLMLTFVLHEYGLAIYLELLPILSCYKNLFCYYDFTMGLVFSIAILFTELLY